jgi:undecaprenyl-diphosphatase
VNTGEAVLLGIVQGLTEFLPISSSGHLALFQHFLNIAPGDLSFEVTVHVGTLIAVLVYFRRQLLELIRSVFDNSLDDSRRAIGRKTVALLALGTVPAVIAGFLLRPSIERLFASPRAASGLLIVTGVWLVLLRYAQSREGAVTYQRAWWVGMAQAAAILPGISRSGATIATGIALGIKPTVAAEFSFLLSIPAILGASALSLPEAVSAGRFGLSHCVGGLTAAIIGYWALSAVFASLRGGRFSWFGAYCLAVGGAASAWLWLID